MYISFISVCSCVVLGERLAPFLYCILITLWLTLPIKWIHELLCTCKISKECPHVDPAAACFVDSRTTTWDNIVWRNTAGIRLFNRRANSTSVRLFLVND